MNEYILQQIALATPEDENFDQKGSVICPKPRPLRWKFCQQSEGFDSKAEEELLLDIIQNQEALSPPYFLGSPPVRASNPLIQDEQFEYEKHNIPQSTSAISSSSGLSSPSSSSSGLVSPSSPLRKAGCVRMKFGIKSAAVRVVGFDCHVPAVA